MNNACLSESAGCNAPTTSFLLALMAGAAPAAGDRLLGRVTHAITHGAGAAAAPVTVAGSSPCLIEGAALFHAEILNRIGIQKGELLSQWLQLICPHALSESPAQTSLFNLTDFVLEALTLVFGPSGNLLALRFFGPFANRLG